MLKLQRTMSYFFKQEQILRQALTRQKAIDEKMPGAAMHSYQALEFVGDAMLKVCVAKMLYEKFPQASVKQLHEMTQGFIQNKNLAATVRRLRLETLIMKGKHEELTDKMLADALEALIGAVLMDSKKMGVACQAMLKRLFKPELDSIQLTKGREVEKAPHPKHVLEHKVDPLAQKVGQWMEERVEMTKAIVENKTAIERLEAAEKRHQKEMEAQRAVIKGFMEQMKETVAALEVNSCTRT